MMKLVQFLISVSFAQLSSTSGCKRPNLEPPDCHQIYSAQWCENEAEFLSNHMDFQPRGGGGQPPPSVTPTCPASCQKGRTHSLAVKGRGAGSCSCHSEGVLMEATTVALDVFERRPALGLSRRPCYREGSTLQRSCCMTLTCNESRCTL